MFNDGDLGDSLHIVRSGRLVVETTAPRRGVDPATGRMGRRVAVAPTFAGVICETRFDHVLRDVPERYDLAEGIELPFPGDRLTVR